MTELGRKILTLKSEGKSYREIEEELGCSKGTISYHLGEGQKEKAMDRQRDRRSKVVTYIQELKQSTPCADCKENYPYYVMEFDHLRDKEFVISHMIRKRGARLDLIKLEIVKCDIVCSNCHKVRTHSRGYRNGSNSLDLSELY